MPPPNNNTSLAKGTSKPKTNLYKPSKTRATIEITARVKNKIGSAKSI